MKKYRLDLDNLNVQSFGTMPEAAPSAGTVFGHQTEFTMCSCELVQCTGAYYTCDMQCNSAQTGENPYTCNLQCTGTGGGGNSNRTICLECYTNANTCTMVADCHSVTQGETCAMCPEI